MKQSLSSKWPWRGYSPDSGLFSSCEEWRSIIWKLSQKNKTLTLSCKDSIMLTNDKTGKCWSFFSFYSLSSSESQYLFFAGSCIYEIISWVDDGPVRRISQGSLTHSRSEVFKGTLEQHVALPLSILQKALGSWMSKGQGQVMWWGQWKGKGELRSSGRVGDGRWMTNVQRAVPWRKGTRSNNDGIRDQEEQEREKPTVEHAGASQPGLPRSTFYAQRYPPPQLRFSLCILSHRCGCKTASCYFYPAHCCCVSPRQLSLSPWVAAAGSFPSSQHYVPRDFHVLMHSV